MVYTLLRVLLIGLVFLSSVQLPQFDVEPTIPFSTGIGSSSDSAAYINWQFLQKGNSNSGFACQIKVCAKVVFTTEVFAHRWQFRKGSQVACYKVPSGRLFYLLVIGPCQSSDDRSDGCYVVEVFIDIKSILAFP